MIRERKLEHLWPLAHWLPTVFPILGAREVESISQTMQRMYSNYSDPMSRQIESRQVKGDLIETDYLFLTLAPHLSRSDRFRLLIRRPSFLKDLCRFEIWFDPLPPKTIREALALIHDESTPQVVLGRVLWMLSHTKPKLTDVDRERIVSLAVHNDEERRGAAAHFAAFAGDRQLGRRLAKGGGTHTETSPSWDSTQRAEVLIRFSDDLSLGEVARRLHPLAVSHVVNLRGNLPDELRIYGLALDRLWFKILQDSGCGGAQHFRESRHANEELIQTAKDIANSWNLESWEFCRRAMCTATARQLHETLPGLFAHWLSAAVDRAGGNARVQERFAVFIAPFGRALLATDAGVGWQIWKAAAARWCNPFDFDFATASFVAQDHAETSAARLAVVANAISDADISHISYLSTRYERHDWLDTTITDLISSGALWRKAKALTLASYSDIETADFEALVARAGIQNSWVANRLGFLRQNVSRNEIAKYWYRVFWEERDSDTWWDAWQAVLECADERFHVWRRHFDDQPGSNSEYKRRFITSNWDAIRGKFDHQKARKDTLYGIQKCRNIYPFTDA